jgi:Asp-tRNA(Asn)/Glu-tRNA(Gln) amidotransferase A subunit family amidase
VTLSLRVGIKPTIKLTSILDFIWEPLSMDAIRPFGRSVENAAIVLDTI